MAIAWLSSALRAGTALDVPAHEVRYVELKNAVALAAIPLVLTYALPLVWLADVTTALLVTLQVPAFLGVVLFHHLGWRKAASVWLVVVALCAFLGQTLLFGIAAGHSMFLFTLASAPALLYGPRESAAAAVTTGIGLVVLLVLVSNGDRIEPRATMPEGSVVWTRGLILGGVYTMLAVVGWYSRRVTLRAEAEARHEHARSERLLLNLLPAPIAARLKATEGPIAERHDDVSVLFADIVGFTEASAQLPPEVVVARLNEVFSVFDALAAEHGAEKIKTIGDAYMAAVGVPVGRPDHLERAADLALAMLAATPALVEKTAAPLTFRLGLHAGPVVAGVLGSKKLVYDLWGDTVNVASRLESTGVPGEIQVSPYVYARLSSSHQLEARGEVALKGRGSLETYFLRGRLRS